MSVSTRAVSPDGNAVSLASCQCLDFTLTSDLDDSQPFIFHGFIIGGRSTSFRCHSDQYPSHLFGDSGRASCLTAFTRHNNLKTAWKSVGLTYHSPGPERVSLFVSPSLIGGLLSEKCIAYWCSHDHRVYDLKAQIYNQTRVPAERQKIIGLVKGRLPPEQERM